MRRWVGFGFIACFGCARVLGADFDETGSDCTELHVSPLGNDANSGCSPNRPKQTIDGALVAARESSQVAKIRICAGDYDEHVVLDTTVDLHGGYTCTDWTRPSGYGFPSFDSAARTRLGDSASPETLRITSAAGASVVDGLTILGPASASAKNGVAVRIERNAAPRLSNCFVQGGGTFSFDADGSVGVRIEEGATPELWSNRIEGGWGRTNSSDGVGRAAIVVDSASPFLHDNEIVGGSKAPQATEGVGSAGLVLRGTSSAIGDRAIRDNDIRGGDGIGPLGGTASIGVMILDESSADIVGCRIEPGHSLGTGTLLEDGSLGTAVVLRGVHSVSTGALKLLRSRVYGGDLSNPARPAEGFRVGAWVEKASSFLAENTIIHAGAADQPPGGEGSPNFALALVATSNPVVRHTTLYSGPSGFPTVGTALKLEPNVRGLILENNVLAADANWNEPIYVEDCASDGVFASVKNNLLFNSPLDGVNIDSLLGYGVDPGSTCKPWQPVSTIVGLEGHLANACRADTGSNACKEFGGTKVSGNLTLRADCVGDSGCIEWAPCGADSLTCLDSAFATWTHEDNGYAALFGEGWVLAPDLPCAISQSSLSIPEVSVDLLGAARTGAPSMGAHEQDSCSP